MNAPVEPRGHEPIAIVGIGCRFPGGATGPDAFWSLLRSGFDGIGEAPARVGLAEFFDPAPKRPGHVLSTQGGYLEDVELFDARFFEIAPIEAARLDPQQRLALMVSWEALEDAGIRADRSHGRTGVFLGVSSDDYLDRILQDPVAVDPYVLAGGCRSFVSARVSYFLDLRGPSMSIDTACSSSLAAVHLACRSLRDGECALALAGGVNVFMRPESYVGLSRGGMLAADGRCKSFDARGDGFVRSEGAGVVVLKRLDRATADGDRVYAVIRGSAINSDGRSSGLLLTPGQGGQEDVIRQACADAGVDPHLIAYVEAHGTGTRAGDPVEIAALAAVLGNGSLARERCRVGSVKSNIGHAEPAAGVAGLIKTVLALHHRLVPPNLHFDEPNPEIAWQSLPFEVPREPVPLDGPGDLFASVNSFGLGGQNAHVLVQAVARRSPEPSPPTSRAHLIPISAHTPSALRTLARRLVDRLEDPDPPALADLAHTGAVRRAQHDVRAAVVAESTTGLIASLEGFLSGGDPGVVTGLARRSRPKIAFVYPGQGAPWPGMGRELYQTEPVFKRVVEQIDAELSHFADWSLVDEIFRGEATSRLDRLDVIQPYIFAVQVGLTELYRAWGIVPDATTGHSMGEAAAAYAAGALSLRDALRIVSVRTQLINRFAPRGAMAAVELSEDACEEALEPFRDRVSVAAVNAPNAVVVSGETEAVDTFVAVMEARGVFARKVRVDCASHSKYMEGVLPELLRELQPLEPRATEVAFYSTVEPGPVDGIALDARYWCRNLRRPVRMKEALERLGADGFTVFLEVSHHPLLATAIASTLEGERPPLLLTSLRRNEPERSTLLRTAAALWVEGHELAAETFAPDGGRFTPWPLYPWEPQRHWLDEVVSEERLGRRPPGPHPLLGPTHSSSIDPDVLSWPCDLDPSMPLLDDHRVGGEALLPATAYVEMMLAAARERAGLAHPSIIDLHIEAATVFTAGKRQQLEVAVSGEPGSLAVRISAAMPEGGWSMRARCEIDPDGPIDIAPVDVDAIRARCTTRQSSDEHYAGMARRGITYGPLYRGVAAIWRRDGEAIGSILEPVSAPWSPSSYIVHPALLDACLQVVVAAMPQDDAGTTVLPVGIDRLRVFGDPSHVRFSHAELVDDVDRQALSARIVLLDARGRALAEVTGLRMRRLDGGARSTTDDERLFEVSFQELGSLPRIAQHAGRWLILGDRGGVGDAVTRSLRTAGGECVDEAALSASDAALAGVVWLRGLDLDDPRRASDAAEIIPLLRTLEGQRGADGLLRLVLVTRGAQSVPGGAAVNAVQAVMLGLGRVIGQEHSELVVKRIDLDPDSADASLLLDEMLATDGEDEIVLRRGKRFAPRLSRFTDGSSVVRLRQARSRSYALARDGNDGNVFREVARPAPKSGEVEIAVNFASLDGLSCTGEVVAAGPGAGVSIGQRVVAVGQRELVARYAIVDARLVWPAFTRLRPADGAIQPGILLTAAASLGRIARGERVRVLGDGVIAASVRTLARLSGAALPTEGDADVLIETQAGLAGKRDVMALSPRGRWVTIAEPAARRRRSSESAAGPNRARVYVDVRALIAESVEDVRELLDPIIAAIDRGDLAAQPARRVAARDIGDVAIESGISVEIPGPELPIVRATQDGSPQDARGTWLVTGGLGGIGRVIAAHLVEVLGARGVVLVGRSAAGGTDPGRIEFVRRLERAGAVVRLEALDVADEAAVTNLFARLAADDQLPPITGVVHAAGVLDDGILVRQDRERFERVFAPKVMGAWNLHRATMEMDLEHFVLFSSPAALIGNPGQGNYAAANAFLDGLAWMRARAGLPALSIAWGRWSEVGLVARRQDRADHMEALGALSITPEEGAQLFEKLLDAQAVAIAAMRFDAARWCEFDPRRAAFLERLLGSDHPDGAETLDRAAVLKLEGARRFDALVRFVRAQVGDVVRLPWEEVPEDQPLGRIGLDSLMAVAVRGRVQRALGVSLPLVRILGGASPLDLARFVDEAIGAETAPGAAEIDRLNDGEVDALLARLVEEGYPAT